jgi:hypothetical protein
VPEDEFERDPPGRDVQAARRGAVGEDAVEVHVRAGVVVVGAGRLAVIFPADEPRVDVLIRLYRYPYDSVRQWPSTTSMIWRTNRRLGVPRSSSGALAFSTNRVSSKVLSA